MTINGRQKGNRNEREVARLLQSWWQSREPGCEFIRTPLSGGWGTATTRGSFKASGDLMTTATQFPYVVEVKAREGWNVKNIMAGARSPVWSWWAQTVKAALEQEGGIPMLWFKKRGTGSKPFPWLVMLPLASAILKPDVTYQTAAKAGVEYSGYRPVLYFADRLLAMSPKDIRV